MILHEIGEICHCDMAVHIDLFLRSFSPSCPTCSASCPAYSASCPTCSASCPTCSASCPAYSASCLTCSAVVNNHVWRNKEKVTSSALNFWEICVSWSLVWLQCIVSYWIIPVHNSASVNVNVTLHLRSLLKHMLEGKHSSIRSEPRALDGFEW